VDEDFADPVLQQIAEVAHEEEQLRREVAVPEIPVDHPTADRKTHTKAVETQTVDLFGLPPVSQSARTPFPASLV
jgi:hypothetical protein